MVGVKDHIFPIFFVCTLPLKLEYCNRKRNIETDSKGLQTAQAEEHVS